MLLQRFFDQWHQLVGLETVAGGTEKAACALTGGAINQDSHSCGSGQRLQERTVEFASANHIKILATRGHGPDGKHAQRVSLQSFHLSQESSLRNALVQEPALLI